MTELVEAYGKKVGDTFYDKIVQCEEIAPPEGDAATWEVLKKANRLRNAVAHKIDGPEVKDTMTKLRTAYAALSEQAAKERKENGPMCSSRCRLSLYCGSVIIVATDNKQKA